MEYNKPRRIEFIDAILKTPYSKIDKKRGFMSTEPSPSVPIVRIDRFVFDYRLGRRLSGRCHSNL